VSVGAGQHTMIIRRGWQLIMLAKESYRTITGITSNGQKGGGYEQDHGTGRGDGRGYGR